MRSELDPEILRLTFFHHDPANPGFAAGHNQNFKERDWKSGDFFVVLNNDVRLPQPTLITDMMQQCAPGTLVSCVIKASDSGEVWFAGARVNRLTGDIIPIKSIPNGFLRETQILCGCCIMSRASTFAALRGFNERFFMYAEDVDLSMRAKRTGCRMVVINRDLLHDIGGYSNKQYSSLYLYQNTKNRLICMLQYRMGLPLIRELFFVLKYVIARTIQLALSSKSPLKQTSAVVKGFLDGLNQRSERFNSSLD